MLHIRAFKVGGHVQSAAMLLRVGAKQAILARSTRSRRGRCPPNGFAQPDPSPVTLRGPPGHTCRIRRDLRRRGARRPAAQQPTQTFRAPRAAGSYLAARHAGGQRDAAAAAAYYRAALQGDPSNSELLDRTFLSLLVNGEIEEAVQFRRARAAGRQDRSHRPPGARGARASSRSNIRRARQRTGAIDARADHRSHRDACSRPGRSPARPRPSLRSSPSTSSPGRDWYAIFKDMHAGMILDLAGQKKEAATPGARLQARSDRAARGAGLRQPARRVTAPRTRRSRSSPPSTRRCRVIR